MANNEIVFDVVENIGVIAKYPTGWNKEVNLISWNNGTAKVDIRDWDPDHLHMSKGVTLHTDEAMRLVAMLTDHFEAKAKMNVPEEEPKVETSSEPPAEEVPQTDEEKTPEEF